jgi:hypothetical protein
MDRRHNPDAFYEIANIEQEIGFTMNPRGSVIELADKWEAGQLRDEMSDNNPKQMCMF